MTESQITQQLLARLKAGIPGGVVVKHSDRFTAGIPDFSVSWNGFTSWLEVKHVRPGRRLDQEVRELQAVFGRRLEHATAGRAWILAYRTIPGRKDAWLDVWRPSVLLGLLRASQAMEIEGAGLTPCQALDDSAWTLLRALGRLRLQGAVGSLHSEVFGLIQRTHTVAYGGHE